jgi:DNA adenine methylase
MEELSIYDKVEKKIVIPFRWAGGKFYALKILQKFWINIDHDEYREPFFGGGSMFWSKKKVNFNWINDIDENLIFFLNFITINQNRESLLKLFENELEATKDKYEYVKKMLPKNDLEKAYKYYYLNRTSYSGKMKNPSWGYLPKRSIPPYRWHEKIIPTSEKLQGVKITNEDFETPILAPSNIKNGKVLLFLDPPYYLAKQESHYARSFKKEDHIRLSNTLKKTKHKFFLTYDDCIEIRELYSWANIYEISFFYRLDNSNNNEKKRKTGNELVITNYKIIENNAI